MRWKVEIKNEMIKMKSQTKLTYKLTWRKEVRREFLKLINCDVGSLIPKTTYFERWDEMRMRWWDDENEMVVSY